MGGQIILKIKDTSKLSFFKELINNLDFVTIQKIVNDAEDIADVKAYDTAKKGKLEFIVAEQLFDEIDNEK